MGQVEVAKTPDFKPVLTIRPHHLSLSEIRNPLLFQKSHNPTFIEDAKDTAKDHCKYMAETGDPTGYTMDVIGNSLEAKRNYIVTYTAFMARLCHLKNSQFVRFDLAPDGLCKSCQFGKHCMGTNFDAPDGPSGDMPKAEASNIIWFQSRLVERNFLPGQAFRIVTTEHTIYDFQGRPVSEHTKAVPIKIEFEAMDVQVGALRASAYAIY